MQNVLMPQPTHTKNLSLQMSASVCISMPCAGLNLLPSRIAWRVLAKKSRKPDGLMCCSFRYPLSAFSHSQCATASHTTLASFSSHTAFTWHFTHTHTRTHTHTTHTLTRTNIRTYKHTHVQTPQHHTLTHTHTHSHTQTQTLAAQTFTHTLIHTCKRLACSIAHTEMHSVALRNPHAGGHARNPGAVL